LLQAAKEYNIDLTQSWMLGDSTRDIEAGMAAGCNTMQISDTFSLTAAIAHIAQEAGWQG
jgi:histidinol phosphatase-like enzyme